MSNYEEIKSRIEKRVIEAREKSMTPKLILIAKNLGQPMISQNENVTFLPDSWTLPDDDELPEHGDWNLETLGYYFDGLKCGINLTVKTLIYEDQPHEVKATYNSYLVYLEEEGRLRAYAPFKVWEDAIEMFYEAAIVAEQKKIKREKEEKKKQDKVRTRGILSRLRDLWNF